MKFDTETNRNFESSGRFSDERFDAAPYPFAVILGATTLLLLITTVRSLWLLAMA